MSYVFDLSKTSRKEGAVDIASRTSETPDGPVPYTDLTTGIEMVLVKGGCYQMGDTFGDGIPAIEKPVHEVTLSDFYLGKYPVTQGQWKDVMGNNPSAFQNGDNYPVEQINWDDAQEFIRKLNQLTGKMFRLPTEAEWEYAARSGGKKEKWAGTSDESELMKYAWYRRNARKKTHPVGRKKPNGLGLYDMIGNVSEWVEDAFKEEAYRLHSRNNPVIPFGVFRVLRGGGWSFDADVSRSASRNFWFHNNPNDILNITGFRVARYL
jgi:formylglycine-generating enzyme